MNQHLVGPFSIQIELLCHFCSSPAHIAFATILNDQEAAFRIVPCNAVVYFGQSSTLFDAMLNYDTPEWRVAINGANIFGQFATCLDIYDAT